jgi:uncharacterized protein
MLKSKPLRLIIDTNLWVSFIISKKLNLLDPLLFAGKIRFIFSAELISEIEITVTKPRLKKFFTGNALSEMLTAFDPYIDFVNPRSKVTVCRDPKDNFLLSLSIDGQADFLLTGDNDLLDLEKFGETSIITISEFLKMKH